MAEKFLVFVNMKYYPYVAYDGDDSEKARKIFEEEKNKLLDKGIDAHIYLCKIVADAATGGED